MVGIVYSHSLRRRVQPRAAPLSLSLPLRKPSHKLLAAQNPKMTVAITPPKEKSKIGASPPSRVVPTRSPTFLAYRRRGPLHWGQRNPAPCSSKYKPAHSAYIYVYIFPSQVWPGAIEKRNMSISSVRLQLVPTAEISESKRKNATALRN